MLLFIYYSSKFKVSRNPTRLPSDVQKVNNHTYLILMIYHKKKVRAVAHPKLSNYFNVIVFPVKGKQSLASYLGGGGKYSFIMFLQN